MTCRDALAFYEAGVIVYLGVGALVAVWLYLTVLKDLPEKPDVKAHMALPGAKRFVAALTVVMCIVFAMGWPAGLVGAVYVRLYLRRLHKLHGGHS